MSKLLRLVLASVAIVLLPGGLYAQGGDGTITGVVIDQANQRPVQEAQVVVTGTQLGATTNQEGRFTIRGVPAGSYEVRVRRVGYAPIVQRVTVTAGQAATANFAVTASAAQLSEVVINAITGQVQRRSDIGVNTGNVNVAELQKGPITKAADVLQGRVAGVTLQSAAGTVGSSQRIRIRGANSLSLSNEPLLYVDGVLASNNKGGFALGGQDYSRLNDLNPEEMENIEILKGPAASAIYGSAAANGVILITTRRGSAGKPVWRAYAESGQSKDVNKYPLNYAALSGPDLTQPYYDISNGGILNTKQLLGPTAPYSICPNYLAALPTGSPGACTQDVVLSFDQFRDPRTTPYQTGDQGKLGLNVSGGSEGLTYFISGDRTTQNGVLRPNSLAQVNVRTNLNARIGTRATAAITAAYIQSSTNRLSNDNSIFSPLINAFLGPAQYIPGMELDTVSTPGSRLGSYFGYNTNDQRKVTADQSVDRFIVGSNVNFTPISWLRLNGNVGLDYFGRFDRQTVNPNQLPLAQSYILGFRDAVRASNYLYTANGSATGTFTPFSSVVSNTTVGTSFQRALFQNVECYGIGIPSGTQSCAATTSQFAVDETQTDERTFGVFGRQEFAVNDRLFLAASLRADNNSGLVRQVSGLSYFPSFNASWVISREPFFPQTGFLSQLRLRAGWGQAGQRPGFGAASTFFSARVVPIGGVESAGLILTNTGNPALKVERTTEVEGGFDAGFFRDRISTEFTVFSRRSRDALVSRNIAPSAGLTTSVFQNLGQISNSGTEFALNVNVLNADRVRLDARLSAATLRNRVDVLGQGIAPIVLNRGAQAYREGFSAGGFFARPIKYNDADGNGKISSNEVSVDTSKFLIVRSTTAGKQLDTLNLAYVGPQLPTNTQGLGGTLTLFRNISISTLFERRAGQKQLNYTEFFRCRTQSGSAFFSQCGALANPNASLRSQAAFIGASAQFQSRFGATPYGYIENADFVKWRELSVRLGIPEALSNQVAALKGAAVSLSGRNLKTWTNYSGLDPEINESGGSTNFTQNEFNTQPPVRTFTLRFDFKF